MLSEEGLIHRYVFFFFTLFAVFAEARRPAGERWFVVEVEDAYHFRWAGSGIAPDKGTLLKVESKTPGVGVVGFALVDEVHPNEGGTFEGRALVSKVSGVALLQVGDDLDAVDLRVSETSLEGRTELLARDFHSDRGQAAARFRPLYLQGFSIGETAQTLAKDEFLVSAFGHVSYGLGPRLSAGVFLPGYFLTSPNANLKWNVWNDSRETVSLGLSLTKIRDSSSTAVNLTVYWDSISSSHMTSHMLATLAVATLEKVEDTVAIKTAGSSSLQTGYEYLLSNWDRVLFGPSYNFETKSLGGYVAYKRVWDRFHLSGSISTVNVRDLKLSPTAYVGLIEAYWRF